MVDTDVSRTQPDRVNGPASLFCDGRVRSDAYRDAKVFDLEMDRIFGQSWVYVAHESEVPSPGDYKTTTIGRCPVIVSRAEDGQLWALVNRCSHRGATVCQAERGTASFFRCAYHGWTYRNDGALATVTFDDGYSGDYFDPALHGLTPLPRVESYRGLIFASLSADVPELTDHLGNAREYIDIRLDAALGGINLRRGSLRYSYPSNWKLQVENSVDGYHPSFVHQSTLQTVGQRTMGGERQGKTIWKSTRGDSPDVNCDLGNGHALSDLRTLLGVGQLERARTWPGGDQYWAALVEQLGEERATEAVVGGSDVMTVYLFPNLVLIQQQIRVIRPRSVNHTDVEMYFASWDGAPEEFNEQRLRQHTLFYGPAGIVGPDDLEMFRRIETGLEGPNRSWVDLQRGLHREETVSGGTRQGHHTDETPQRAFWRRWAELMADA